MTICDICDFVCVNKQSKNAHDTHHRTDHKDKKYQCGQCSFAAVKLGVVHGHIIVTHNDSICPLICGYCGSTSYNRHKFLLHYQNSHQEKQFIIPRSNMRRAAKSIKLTCRQLH